MKNPLLASFVILSTLVASGCGGGGGGGGSQDSAPRGVRILHGSIDATPLDIYSTSIPGAVVQRGGFAAVQKYAELKEGPQTISVTRAKNPSTILRSFNVEVGSKQRYSMVLFGDSREFGLSTRLLDDSPPAERGDGALLRVVDAMTGAAEITVSAGEFSAPRGSNVTTKVEYGGASQYLNVPAGTLRITTQRSADGKVVSAITADLLPGEAYTLLVAGEADYYVKSNIFED